LKFNHRVDRYAKDVDDGRIVAGPLVRLACERHLRDRHAAARKSGHRLGLFFHEAAATHIIEFFEGVLRLPDTLDEDGDPVPFLLTPANTFIVGSIFGWKMPDGYRRFREAYIEEGKGNAKTPLAAGIGLYGLTMDGEQAAEIYSVASGIEQARICWRDADRMVEASPDLRELIYRGVDNLAYAATYSWFRPLSKEKRGKSGPRPHMTFFDEEHEYADAVVVNKMRAGTKRRRQPLSLGITNSGFDRTSICWQHHEHARKVMEGVVEDEQFFGFVCGLDKEDDPLTDESCWPKANPNLGYIIQPEYLRRQVQNAANIPSETNTVLRLNFCVWTKAHTQAINAAQWAACQEPPPDEELRGKPCYGGLDLGQSDDFSAWARIWDLGDRLVVKMRFWIPEATLEKYPNRPYDEWQRLGALTVTEGNTTDYTLIEETIADDCAADGVREVGYDNRFAEQMAQNLQGRGIVVVNTGQGFQLNEAIKRMLEHVVNGTFCHGDDPVLGWMASNFIVRHGTRGEVRPDKEKAGDKIDGIVACDMAIDRIVRTPKEPTPSDPVLVVA